MYEHRSEPLIPPKVFLSRLATHILAAIALVIGSLGLGMAGYHWLVGLSWVDAFLNAAMILGGMGPVAELQTSAAKLFAGGYALFSGLVFLIVVGVVGAPVIHRAMHRFHFDEDSSMT